MNIEQQRKFLEALGYTIKKVHINHVYPETRSSEREECIFSYSIAFKGEEPIFEDTFGDIESKPTNLEEYCFDTVARKEAENLMYEIMMEKISRQNLKKQF